MVYSIGDIIIEHFAIIGNPITHSLSPQIHQLFAKQINKVLTYTVIQCEVHQFAQTVQTFFAAGGIGLNVTAPFKQVACTLADVITPRCSQAQAANTLWLEDHKLYADNTDGVGFMLDIKRYLNLSQKNILILGSGGAVRGILGPLLRCDPQSVTLWGRTMERIRDIQQLFPTILSINNTARHASQWHYDLIINATSYMT